MDQDTAEGKAISEVMFDILDWAIIVIIWCEFISRFTTNVNKICIKLMRNTNFISITYIFMLFSCLLSCQLVSMLFSDFHYLI